MVAIKTFALADAVLGILVIFHPFVWCYTPLVSAIEYLFLGEIVVGAIIFIAAILALNKVNISIQ